VVDYSSLKLTDVFMHQVSKGEPSARPRFSTLLTDEPVDMGADDKAFLTRRFIKALGRGAVAVVEAAQASPLPAAVKNYWAGGAPLVSVSQAMAESLANTQPATALPGLLVVAEATLGSDPCILVAKVEHQEAMRFNAIVSEGGHRIFQLHRLSDLVFGDAVRIYKIAVLSKAASSTGQLAGTLADEQNGAGQAAYYLRTFLGMKLREEPPVLTEQYMERMGAVVNKSTMPVDKKVDAQMALLAGLKSNAPDIDAQRFIREFIPVEYHSQIRDLAQQAEVPLVRFAKDVSRVSSRLVRVRIDMSNDVYVIAPYEAVGEGKQVVVSESNGAAGPGDTVTITGGSLKNIKPNGSR
jgi:hypothetical protein